MFLVFRRYVHFAQHNLISFLNNIHFSKLAWLNNGNLFELAKRFTWTEK